MPPPGAPAMCSRPDDAAAAPAPAAAAAATATPVVAAARFRHTRYADLDYVFADTADPRSVFPRSPAECGPIVIPVIISRSHR